MDLEQAEEKANQMIKKENITLRDEISTRLSSQVNIIDFMELQCPNGACEIFDDEGNILYLDDSHFSYEGIFWIGQRIKEEYSELF